MFVNTAYLAHKYDKALYFKGQEDMNELHSDTTFFNTYIDLFDLINSEKYPY